MRKQKYIDIEYGIHEPLIQRMQHRDRILQASPKWMWKNRRWRRMKEKRSIHIRFGRRRKKNWETEWHFYITERVGWPIFFFPLTMISISYISPKFDFILTISLGLSAESKSSKTFFAHVHIVHSEHSVHILWFGYCQQWKRFLFIFVLPSIFSSWIFCILLRCYWILFDRMNVRE